MRARTPVAVAMYSPRGRWLGPWVDSRHISWADDRPGVHRDRATASMNGRRGTNRGGTRMTTGHATGGRSAEGAPVRRSTATIGRVPGHGGGAKTSRTTTGGRAALGWRMSGDLRTLGARVFPRGSIVTSRLNSKACGRRKTRGWLLEQRHQRSQRRKSRRWRRFLGAFLISLNLATSPLSARHPRQTPRRHPGGCAMCAMS